MQTMAQLIKNAVEQYGDEDAVSFRNSYSGRGMFARECVGIVGDEALCMQIIRQCIKDAHALDDVDFDELVDTILDFSRDTMGRSDVILYWPTVEPLDISEEEDDHQPDEAQEWRDFDPDC